MVRVVTSFHALPPFLFFIHLIAFYLFSRRAMSLRYAVRLHRIKRHSGIRHLSVAIPRRPYGFHMGVSFAGKPPLDEFDKTKHPSFPSDSAIAKWRDESLQWPKGLLSTNAGHDFFFVQEVNELAFRDLPFLCRPELNRSFLLCLSIRCGTSR